MKAIICQHGELRVDDVPAPVPAGGQVVIEVKRCGICGSDLHARKSCDELADLTAELGYGGIMRSEQAVILGHEYVGEITDVGPGATLLRPGTRVVAMPLLRANGTFNPVGLSADAPGGFAEQVLAEQALTFPVPNGLDTDTAALTEPMAVGLHAVRQSDIKKRDVAVVVGCGPVGLAIICMLKAHGVATIVASDFSADRRALAQACGADVLADPAEDSPFAKSREFGHLVDTAGAFDRAHAMIGQLRRLHIPWHQVWRAGDLAGVMSPRRPVIFECVGMPGVIDQLIKTAPLMSRIVVAGVCMQTDRFRPAMASNKQVELRFVVSYTPRDFIDALHLLAGGKVKAAPVLTGVVGLDGVPDAFSTLEGGAGRHAKILVDPKSPARLPDPSGEDLHRDGKLIMTAVSDRPVPAEDDQYARIVAGTRAVFTSGRTRSYEWRARQLAGLARLLDEGVSDIARAIEADLGRSPFEARLFDIVPTKTELQHARKHLRRWMRARHVPAPLSARPGRAWYQFEPVGVVLIIAPWNYPVHLALAPLIATLAAGNCAVIKPSEVTPACSAVLARLLSRYVDPDAVVVVEGGAEASLGLLGQAVDHCFFTGSPAVGSAIMAAAAPHLTPVTLELGGKCPAIVTSSARLDTAARRIAFGKLVNSGQTCVAPDYVLVDRSVRDDLVTELAAALTRFSAGRTMPIVNARHAARLAGLLADAGGTVALGGTVDVAAAQAEPTVVVDPDPRAKILREEIFGPILPVVTVDSVDEAIAHVQRGGRPLASYLFSENRRDERRVIDEVVSGGTVVNHVMMHLAVNDLPFGGIGTSGMGRYHGRWGFETLSNARAILRKPSRPDITLFYPPYSGLTKRIIDRVM